MASSKPLLSGQNNQDLVAVEVNVNDLEEEMLKHSMGPSRKLKASMKSSAMDLTGSPSEVEEAYTSSDSEIENLEQCCIYRVPKYLRKINEEAYTPQVISIGPLHRDNKELSAMETEKKKFVTEFHKRIRKETWQKLTNFIEENELRIRNCYAEMPEISDSKFFREMILNDAVFIIAYLLRSRVQSDFLINNLRRVKWPIWTDLLLLENQLPYFVLKKLYKLAFSQHGIKVHPSFFSLSFQFFCFDMPKQPQKKEVKHFTDLRRYAMTNSSGAVKPQESREEPKLSAAKRDLPCVVKLQKSGVNFKCSEKSESFLDITLEKTKLLRCLNWKVLEPLQIPPIGIYDQTECWIRNVMALEQCHYPDETHVCNYISLMDDLINTEEDVNLLVEKGIISNCVGNTDTIAKMFNGLCLHIALSTPSCYDQVVEDLKAHYNYRWNHTKATLKRVYFSNLWRGTGTVAAIVLLVLTLIQTICSIISVV